MQNIPVLITIWQMKKPSLVSGLYFVYSQRRNHRADILSFISSQSPKRSHGIFLSFVDATLFNFCTGSFNERCIVCCDHGLPHEGLMIMRVYAMSDRSRAILLLLLGCLFVETSVFIVTGIITLLPSNGTTASTYDVDSIIFCGLVSATPGTLAPTGWVNSTLIGSIAALEVLLVSLSMYKFAQDALYFVQAWRHILRRKLMSDIYSVLIRDNVFWALLTLVSSSLNFKTSDYPQSPDILLDIVADVFAALPLSMMGPHLVLSMKAESRSERGNLEATTHGRGSSGGEFTSVLFTDDDYQLRSKVQITSSFGTFLAEKLVRIGNI
ncbi:hypothetical protein CONPUDRAFT_73949 [Coniophora puteana RWD-64-598 SS2]|uniref:Uncharacterized protein n=1 Tax=Coniophora puteana (strain RWD-64-598) TaxID=741705 RepID=A0A5M3MJY9_CONPW|nr:uncharacterized protein CONPUDRAFT_73949 [Coniophora puteana RWD-64-598 SS2]EIW79532.1 hypothetical protein CONPUDRAFT_73949 [Coniophora puteana RWD-64-598 SS2]